MKRVIFLLFFPILTGCCGNKQQSNVPPQTFEDDVVVAVEQLMNAMIAADERLLTSILADELVYGHSGGKVQNKSEFITEIICGEPLKYISIEPLEQTIQMAGDAAVVRHIFTSETMNADGTPGYLEIGVMQVWKLHDGRWKLLARQAYKL